MFPVPRRREKPSDATERLEAAIIAIIGIQNNIIHRATCSETVTDECLRKFFLRELDSLVFTYQDASRFMQMQEGLEVIVDDSMAYAWGMRRTDLEKHLDKHPNVIRLILQLIAKKISLVENEAVPIITPENVHAAIAEAIVDDAEEMYPEGYFQQFM